MIVSHVYKNIFRMFTSTSKPCYRLTMPNSTKECDFFRNLTDTPNIKLVNSLTLTSLNEKKKSKRQLLTDSQMLTPKPNSKKNRQSLSIQKSNETIKILKDRVKELSALKGEQQNLRENISDAVQELNTLKSLSKEISDQEKEINYLQVAYKESQEEKAVLKKKFEKYEFLFSKIQESLKLDKDVNALEKILICFNSDVTKKTDCNSNLPFRIVSPKSLRIFEDKETRSKSHASLQSTTKITSKKDLTIRITNKSPYDAPSGILTSTSRRGKKSFGGDLANVMSQNSPYTSETEFVPCKGEKIEDKLVKLKERAKNIIEFMCVKRGQA